MNTIKASFDYYRNAVMKRYLYFYSFKDFIFRDFKLIFDDMSYENKGIDQEYTVHFDPSEKILLIENKDFMGCDYQEYYFAKAQWIYLDDITTGVGIMLPEYKSKKYPDESDKVAHDMCRLVLWYMGWIMDKGQKRNRENRASQRKYKYSREHRISTSNNKIWLFDDVVNYVSDTYVSEGQHHSIQCPCWEVRGHYRHYKSGKVVFIPTYKKGKQRDKAEPKPKEYYV